ncbi:hypothetical protein OSB04_018220 [Centaurea solstitialis]|uniref:TF-B3 domain-containing protein n=1 Tax=Centaurea solstitialis TaxID=347529 RepID=A0AA38T4D6_9ASTR|nr:hypothetical protein OSB04_018220 [Centaurea solstitialis]
MLRFPSDSSDFFYLRWAWKWISIGFINNTITGDSSIPRPFLANLNVGSSCSKAILRRGGHRWPVEIADGGFSGDGWRKCVSENGVQEFDFMVFKHQGNMVFDFLVFDPSACERPYPTNPPAKMELEHHTQSDSEPDCCFMSKITPYYMKSSRLASVPREFARSNGLYTEGIRREVIIRDETGRKWPATISYNRIQIGREFKVKNHLKIGDTCTFELVKRGQVVVFDFSRKKPSYLRVKDTNSTLKKATRSTSNNHSTLKKVTRSTSNNHPYFTSILVPWTIKKSLMHLPIDFVRSNGLKTGKMILRDDKSRLWEVLLKKTSRERFYLGCGFRAFQVANELKEGDAYKFELIENKKNKPPVVHFSCKSCIMKEEDDDQPRTYFVNKLKSSSMRKSILYLPIAFVNTNGLCNVKEMILRNGKDERSWIVEFKNYMNKYFYIGRGWNDFRVANGLKKGDHFKLEIVDNIEEKLVMNFYVLKDQSRLL